MQREELKIQEKQNEGLKRRRLEDQTEGEWKNKEKGIYRKGEIRTNLTHNRRVFRQYNKNVGRR